MDNTSRAQNLSREIQAAFEEVERCIAETNIAFEKVQELECKANELVKEFPDQAKQLGINVAKFAYDQTGSVVSGLGYGAAMVGAVLIVSAASWLHGLWSKFKCAQLFHKLLEEKQSLAREKILIIEQLKPILISNIKTIKKILKKESGVIIHVNNFPFGVQYFKGIHHIFSMYTRSVWSLNVVDYISEEMNAWLDGKHSSEKKRPSLATPFLEGVELVISAGPFWSQKKPLLERSTIGRLFLLRNGALKTLTEIAKSGQPRANELRSSLGQISRALAMRRISSRLQPFGTSAAEFRAFDRFLLGGCEPVKTYTTLTIFLLIVIFLVIILVLAIMTRAIPHPSMWQLPS